MNKNFRLSSIEPFWWTVGGCLSAVIVGVFDYYTAPQAMIFYLIPVMFAARYGGLVSGIVVSVSCCLVWVQIDVIQAIDTSSPILPIWNMISRTAVFSTFAVVLTWMVAARRQVEQVNQFLVHDLRSPLTSTISGLQMLRELAVARKDEAEVEVAEMGIVGGKRCLILIDSILDTGRLMEGEMPVHLMEVIPDAVITHAIKQVRLWGDSSSIFIEHRGRCDDVIAADPILTERVLVNLIGNAIKFSPPMSVITVKANVRDGEVEFSVTDNGPGMSSRHAKAVFGKYSQARGLDNAKSGTGLGLTFCRLAVEAQFGRIWLSSELGEGTTVTFALPLAAKKPQQARMAASVRSELN